MRTFGFVKWLLTAEVSEFWQVDFEMRNDKYYFWNAFNWYILKA